MTKALIKSSYQKLLSSIKNEITRGIRDMEKLLEKQKVLTYWNVGQSIHHYLKTSVASGEIGAFYENLARDLDTNPRTLQQCEQFHTLFDKKDLKEGLTWTHYRYLFSVEDKRQRQKWITRCLKNQWASKDLKMNLFLETRSLIDKTATAQLKDVTRGSLYTYRLVPVAKGQGFDDEWMIDCGFANRIETPRSSTNLNNKYLYTSQKTKEGYCLKVTKATVDQLYTYQARLLRVIDGDTLLVMIDQGFGLWTEQRLRLKGIDAPEVTTALGRKAKEWVSQTLQKLPFIIVRTSKSDKYDRYLADVFYLPKERDPHTVAGQGIYLNQELLEQGYAALWK